MGDEVRDRLGLAGAGRALEHHGRPGRGAEDRAQLARVVGHRSEDLGRADGAVELAGRRQPGVVRIGLGGPVDQVLDERAPTQIRLAVPEVAPEQVLRERVEAHLQRLVDAPPVHVLDRALDDAEHEGDVDATIVRGQRVEAGDLDLVVAPQVFEQGHVDPRLVGADREAVALAPPGLALELEGHEEQRRAARPRGLVRLEVLEEADGQVEAARTALLPGGARLAVEMCEPLGELRLAQGRVELAALDAVLEEPLQRLEIGGGRVRDSLELRRARDDAEGLALGQPVLDRAEIGAREEGQDALRGARRVEQPVAHGQVEELTQPAVQARRGRLLELPASLLRGQVRLHLGVEVAAALDPRVMAPAPLIGLRRLLASEGPDRPDAPESSARHVDGAEELRGVLEPRSRLRARAVEAGRGLGGDGDRVHHDDLRQLDPLPEARELVDHGRVEGALDEPRRGHGVALGHDHDRVQARLLQARALEEREVEAGRQAGAEDARGEAHALARGLEARRRVRVRDALGGDRAVDRLGDAQDPLGVLGLVAVEGRLTRALLQESPRPGQDRLNGVVVRQDERGEDLRQGPEARPGVRRMHPPGLDRGGELRAGSVDEARAQGALGGLADRAQHGVVVAQERRGATRPQLEGLPRSEGSDAQRRGQDEGRIGGHLQGQIAEVLRGLRADLQRLHRRHARVEHRAVDLRLRPEEEGRDGRSRRGLLDLDPEGLGVLLRRPAGSWHDRGRGLGVEGRGVEVAKGALHVHERRLQRRTVRARVVESAAQERGGFLEIGALSVDARSRARALRRCTRRVDPPRRGETRLQVGDEAVELTLDRFR